MPSKQFITPVYQFIRISCVGIIVMALLNGCASTPTTNTGTVTAPEKLRLMSYEKLSRMLDPQKSIEATKHAEVATRRAQYTLAENYLTLITLNDSNLNLHQKALVTAATLVAYTDQPERLSAWFSNNTSTTTPHPLVDSFNFNVAIRNNSHQKAAALGLSLSNNGTQNSDLLQQLWQSLQALNVYDIHALLNQQVIGSQGMGWASFAAAYSSNGSSLQQQAQKIADWQIQWPGHTANHIAAADIEALQQQARQMGSTAVVAIPLTGRLSNPGKAIQAAIIATHLNRPQFSKLIFVNSANHLSSSDLLNAIQPYQPDVIIGPIDKTKAHDLAADLTRTTPLIALNAFDTGAISDTHAASYQLSLNIEDEAEFLADASPESFTHALLISTTNPLANRAANAFERNWNNRDDAALIAAPLASSSDFSKDIERYFLLTDSHSRQSALENIFIEKMESNPRRRKDIDVVFLSATANEARAINPLLAYHYAGDLPVLSPSIVFDGRYDSVSNHDLTGIVFSDTPWVITPPALKASMQYHAQNGGVPSKNLHALGIDAYYFAARIKLWKKDHYQSFNGLSGQRLINPNGKTKRTPALALIAKQGIIPQTKIAE